MKKITASGIAVVCAIAFVASSRLAGAAGDADAAYRMPKGDIQTRWFTWENPKGEKGKAGTARSTRKGAPCVPIPKGKSLTILDVQGSGTVRHIWSTLWDRSPEALRGLKIEAWWDGAASPAIQAPFGDFFCHSMGHMTTFENDCFSSPEGRSFNCFVAMPFKKSAKMVITNESDKDNGIYYEVDATLGDQHGDDMLYFHSYWRRENMTTLRQDMTILPKVEGKGRFLGCNLGVRLHPACTGFWWGEGEVKAYLDGDTDLPTLCGTGTEDYVCSAYGQGLFSNRYTGNPFVGKNNSAYGFYRFHIPDPVYFHKDIRVTIQVMGGPSYEQMLDSMNKNPGLKFMKAGEPNQYYTREELEKEPKRADVMERTDDHCATAYWYMDKPENNLGAIAPFAERMKDLPEKP